MTERVTFEPKPVPKEIRDTITITDSPQSTEPTPPPNELPGLVKALIAMSKVLGQ